MLIYSFARPVLSEELVSRRVSFHAQLQQFFVILKAAAYISISETAEYK